MAIPLPRILCAVPKTPPARLEIIKAIQALATPTWLTFRLRWRQLIP